MPRTEFIPNPSGIHSNMFGSSGQTQANMIRQRRQPSRLMQIDSGTHSCRTTCQDNFKRFLSNSTLHGLKYVGDNTITLFER